MEQPPALAASTLDPRDPDPEVRERILLWLALQQQFSLQPERVTAALADGAEPESLLSRGRPDRGRLERSRSLLARLGARLVAWGTEHYPLRLARLPDAPPVLAVRGAPAALEGRAVAVVGSRAATAYGRWAARALAGGLARAGVAVVSGLARGIDAEAHRAALGAGGVTVAFLACGLDRVYPAAHRPLAAAIAEGGAVVSEFPPGTPPRGSYFPLRNRLISGLAEAVVVVEARLRSGSLVTARHAADQGVDVLAVPGPIDGPTHRGTNQLLRDGAGVVTCVGDVLDAIGLTGSAGSGPGAGPEGRFAAPGPAAQALLTVLADGPLGRDELGRRAGMDPATLALPLLELQLDGRVEEDRDGRLRVRSPRRAPRL